MRNAVATLVVLGSVGLGAGATRLVASRVAPPPPPLAVFPASIDLGRVTEGADVSGKCWIANPTNKTLWLEPVTTSCGCTTAKAPLFVAPHSREPVAISFHSAYRTGPVKQAVYVRAKGSETPITIPVVGDCHRDIVLSSPVLDMGDRGQGTLTVERTDGQPLAVTAVNTPATLTTTTTRLSPTKAQVHFTVKGALLAGSHEEKAVLHLNHPALPALTLPVSWHTTGVYTVAPTTANFGMVPHGASRTRTITLSGANTKDIQVVATTGGVKAVLAPPAGNTRLLTIAWVAARGTPLLQGTVTLSTGNRAEPHLSIPVYAAVTSGASGDCSADRPCSQAR